MIISSVLKSRKLVSQLHTFKFCIENAAQIRCPSVNYCYIRRRYYHLMPLDRYKILNKFVKDFVRNDPKVLSNIGGIFHKRCSSNVSNSTEIGDVREELVEVDIKKQFPEPRVTLNILASKLPHKVFDIYYKQNSVATKASKKSKGPVKNDWTSCYAFRWPEQRKFESTAISKKQAAEKAATSAVSWLYNTRTIDKHGIPIVQKVDELSDILNAPVKVVLSRESEELMGRLVRLYEGEIKDLLKSAHEAAMKIEEAVTTVVSEDSTIEDEDEMSDDDLQSKEDEVQESHSELQKRVHPVYGRPVTAPSVSALMRRDQQLERMFRNYDENRTPLPIDGYTDAITEALDSSRVLIVAGAAGCGKSTRAPAAILHALGARAHVLVSEPRRVAARGLAARVADEMGEEVGNTVGYQVRLQSKLPRPVGGSILYCTSGVLLRRLQTNPGLEGCTHVLMDEAHERDINTDIAMLLLKRALELNQNLKLIVMSATLDINVFTRYFDCCQVLEVPGRTFPVEAVYLEGIPGRLGLNGLENMREGSGLGEAKPMLNCKEIAEVITAIDKAEEEGGILVFLPGWAEIKAVKQLLEERFKDSGRHFVLPVHSKLSISEQARMFNRPPPGVRKVVLATNIAETSLTIPDVTCVLDTGACKENRMRRGSPSLELSWVSQASAKQRMGRAGRVQPGRCYKLYTREKEAKFLTHTSPEILRVPLEKTVLDCKIYAAEDKVEDFLSQLPEPPTKQAIKIAVDDLVDLGALSLPDRRLTHLGRLVSALTLQPRLACALLHSAVTRTAASMLRAVTQAANAVDVFRDALERREEIRQIKLRYHPTSDHLALLWIQEEFEQLQTEAAVDQFCSKLGLRKDRMYAVKALCNLHLEQLLQCGMLGSNPGAEGLSDRSDVDALIVATLFSGVDSLLKTKDYVKTKGKVQRTKDAFTSWGERAHISSDSVNRVYKRREGAELMVYCGGVHSPERRAHVPRGTSVITPLAVVLFSRRAQTNDNQEEWTPITFPRHKLTIHVSTSQADLLLTTRSMLWDTFQYFIERDNTSTDEEHTKILDFRDKLVSSVATILVDAENGQFNSSGHRESRS